MIRGDESPFFDCFMLFVLFSRLSIPLPDIFYEVHKHWWKEKMTPKQATQVCGIAKSTFYDKVKSFEKG